MKEPRFANLDNYLLCSIPNEAKCMEFVADKDKLVSFGMEQFASLEVKHEA